MNAVQTPTEDYANAHKSTEARGKNVQQAEDKPT